MEKKVYNVSVHYDVCFNYNIEAEDEEEARNIADEMSSTESSTLADWSYTESCTNSEMPLAQAKELGIFIDNKKREEE